MIDQKTLCLILSILAILCLLRCSNVPYSNNSMTNSIHSNKSNNKRRNNCFSDYINVFTDDKSNEDDESSASSHGFYDYIFVNSTPSIKNLVNSQNSENLNSIVTNYCVKPLNNNSVNSTNKMLESNTNLTHVSSNRSACNDLKFKKKVFSIIKNNVGSVIDKNPSMPLKILKGHKDIVTSVNVSNDYQKLFSGSANGAVKVWDLTSFKNISSFGPNSKYVHSIIFNNLSKQIICGSNSLISFYDLEKLKCIKTIDGHQCGVMSFYLSSDNCKLFAKSFDGIVKIWSLKDFGCLNSIKTFGTSNLCLYNDGKNLVFPSKNHSINFWDIHKKNKCIRSIPNCHSMSINSMCLSNNNKLLLSGSDDKYIKIWNMKNYKIVGSFFNNSHCGVSSLCLTNDNKYIISTCNRQCNIWNIKSKMCLEPFSVNCDDIDLCIPFKKKSVIFEKHGYNINMLALNL